MFQDSGHTGGDSVLSFENASEASEVEVLQTVILPCGSGFAATEQSTENLSLVHLRLVVGPHPLAQSGHHNGSFDDPLVNLPVQRPVAASGGVKIGEVITNSKQFIVDDGGRCRNILIHVIGLKLREWIFLDSIVIYIPGSITSSI